MSRICLFALFLILSIVRFGNCENNAIYEDDIDCTESAPGSDKTHLSPIEKIIKNLKLPIDAINDSKKKDRKSNNNNNILQGSIHNVTEASNFGLIYPGTLWCGDGDRAKNESDLGVFNKTDACCRGHDNCKNDILAGDTKVNLKNNGIFTRSACICDTEFHKCLKNANSPLSKGIGDTYFNILQPQCFTCVCPTDGCKPNKENADCYNQCDKYKWVDNPKF